eukprot:6125219-Pyramimonas_sp.AAC.2
MAASHVFHSGSILPALANIVDIELNVKPQMSTMPKAKAMPIHEESSKKQKWVASIIQRARMLYV